MRWSVGVLVMAALLAGMPQAAGQTSGLYDIQLELPPYETLVPLEEAVYIPFLLHDLSRDSTSGLAGPGAPDVALYEHQIRLNAIVTTKDPQGWTAQVKNPVVYTTGGETLEGQLMVQTTTLVHPLQLNVTVQAVFDSPEGRREADIEVVLLSFGTNSFLAIAPVPATLRPDAVTTMDLRIRNNALLERAFDIQVEENPCDLWIAKQNGNVVDAKTERRVPISVGAPDKKFWYNSDNCPVRLVIKPSDAPASGGMAVQMVVTVDGFYFAPEWGFSAAAILITVLVVVFFVKRRKERIEEEILGKPQKPWTIPVEQVYLKHLKAQDERAWYVVRHHLMEEEYRSALLWHEEYRKATKGQAAKETLVLRQEQAYERWKARQQRRIEAPERGAQRYATRLQRKLDRKARRAHKKALRKHKALVAKQRAGYEKKVARAEQQQAKAVRRAEKRGDARPPPPSVPEPDYGREPVLERIPLETHRWRKKAERARRRAVKKRGDLEVRFEKADAKRLVKMRRKARRVARKIDDPDFVREHPLLSD